MRVALSDRAKASSRVTLLLCSLVGLWAIGLGARRIVAGGRAFADGPARAGGERRPARRGRRRSRVLQRHPLRGAARRRPAVAAAPAGGEVDWRTPGRGVRGGLHAGTVRPAPGRRRARAAGALGRLPVPERLAPRERHASGEAARDGLDLRGRIRGRLGCLAHARRGRSSPSRASSSSASTTAWGASASSRSPR